MLKRRDFLASSARAALLPALALKAGCAGRNSQEEWRNRQSGMSYRRLGRTGFMISEVVMGGGNTDPADNDHIRLALDMGLNYLDTAPAYGEGRGEETYSSVIRERKRDQFFLNSKVSLWDLNRNRLYQDIFDSLSESEQTRLRGRVAEEIERRKVFEPDYVVDYFSGQRGEVESAALSNVMAREFGQRIDRDKNYRKLILDSVDQSLSRLGTDHLDILMCPHGANTPFELQNHPEIFEAFEFLRKAGKVRHLGVSAHSDPAGILSAAIDTGVYSVAMVAYNVINGRYLKSVLEAAQKNDLGVIAMKVARPVHSGGGNAPVDAKRIRAIHEAVPGSLKVPQKAYLWALGNRNISAVVSDMRSAGMVRDNLSLAGKGA